VDEPVQPAKVMPAHRPYSYPADLLLPNGQLDLEAHLPRRLLVDEMGLKPRDIVDLFSRDRRLGFGLTVRSGGIVLSLGKDGPSIVIGQDGAWILDQNDHSGRHVGRMVQKQFLEVASMAATPATSSQTKGRPVKSLVSERPLARSMARPRKGGSSLTPSEDYVAPFTLVATEAAVVICLDRLTLSLRQAMDQSAELLDGFTSGGSPRVSTVQLEALRRTKQRLDYLRAQAKALQDALCQALADVDDMKQLAGHVGPSQEEWELCFEHYSQRAEEVSLEAKRLLETLEDLESSISLSLSCRRLELEKLQLELEVFGNGLGVGALITGAFGMNVMSGLEVRRIFWPICIGIGIVCLTACGVLRWLVARRLRQQGTSPSPVLEQRQRELSGESSRLLTDGRSSNDASPF